MNGRQLLDRHFSASTQLDPIKIRKGELTVEQREQVERAKVDFAKTANTRSTRRSTPRFANCRRLPG